MVQPFLSWSPDSRSIATFRLNQEGARRLALVQSTPPDGAQPRVFEYVYTLPGDTETALASGLFFDVETGTRTDMALAPDPVLYYFGPYYQWSADSKAVFARLIERGYKRFQLYRVDASTGAASLLSEDRSDTYLETGLISGPTMTKTDMVYWTADQTGYFQLMASIRARARRQLTSGDWVVRNVAGVDKASGKLLVTGTGREAGRDPYLRHLYALPSKGGAIKLLTPEPLDHDVSVSPDGSFFVDNMSLINQPTRSVLRSASDGRILMELGRADISAYLAAGYILPEPFETMAADGETKIYGAIFKPAHFDPDKRYPIIEEIYTGPQIIANSPKAFEAALSPLHHAAIADRRDRGDGRRSRHCRPVARLPAACLSERPRRRPRRSHRDDPRDGREVSLDGYLPGRRLRLLGGRLRRGARAHRAAGFLQGRPTGAGVQDNRLDKAWWNEQWMGKEMGPMWDANSNITWASKLVGKLMIVHGELDDNVPLANSLRLVDALIKANKDFELLIIPNANHPVMAVPYFWRRQWDFFMRELLGQDAPGLSDEAVPIGSPLFSFFVNRSIGILVGAMVASGAGRLAAGQSKADLLWTNLETAATAAAAGFDGVMAIAIRDLTDGRSIAIRGDEVMPTASMIKIAVLVELYRQNRLKEMYTVDAKDLVPGKA